MRGGRRSALGGLGLFVRALGESGLLPLDVVGVRAIVTALALLIFLLVRSPGRLAVRLRDVWCFVGTGICSIVFFNLCYFTAVRMMSLASAAVLLYTAPAFVMVLSRLLFGERLTRRRLAALLGVVCYGERLSAQTLLGLLLVLLGIFIARKA